MKNFLLAFVAWVLPLVSAVAQQPQPLGVWVDDRGETHIELYRCGEQLCGRLVWLRQPTNPAGQPLTDQHNPTPSQRNRPLQGLVIMQGLRPDGAERWSNGSIYDPATGRTYSCDVRLLSAEVLEVKGYIGFSIFGRAHRWKRLPEAASNR